METHLEFFFQMFVVDHQAQNVKIGIRKAEKYAAAHVVNARLLGAVKGRQVPVKILFWPGKVQAVIGRLVVGFLEKNIGADSGFFEFAVIFSRCRGDIHIDAADLAVFKFHSVNCFYALKDIFDGTFRR